MKLLIFGLMWTFGFILFEGLHVFMGTNPTQLHFIGLLFQVGAFIGFLYLINKKMKTKSTERR